MYLLFVSLLTLWKRPRIVVLDLRPLQCGYAGKGIGRCTRELALRIAAKAESGTGSKRSRIMSLVMAEKENPLAQIPVCLSAPPWKRPWIWDQTILPWQLFLRRVLIFHNFVALGPLPQISFPVLCRYRGIAQIHDWHMFASEASDVEKFYRRTLRIRIQKRWLPKVRRLIVDSEAMKVEAMTKGWDSSRINIVHLGSDHFESVKSESWPMDNFALSVGDTPNKNLAFTHEILVLLRSRFIHLNWVIVGNRETVTKQLGLENGKSPEWITILEAPTDGVLKSCYQKALALVFPSTREGFGIPVLEAMQLGCPVLATDLEPMKALMENVPGLLPAKDHEAWGRALSRLLHDQTVRQTATEAGIRRAAEFTWDRAAESLLKLYASESIA